MKLLMFLDNVETCMACGGADIVRIIKFIWSLLEIVLFVIPIGLVIMIMVDFMKNVMAGKEDEMKKNLNIAIKRIIYCVVLFLVPTIVSFAISLVSPATNNVALQCIDLVTNNTAEDLNTSVLPNCQVDYENLGESIDTPEETCYQCKDSDKEIFVWSYAEPSENYNGCTSGYMKSGRSKEWCGSQSKSCWKCLDNSGYVLRDIQPGGGYKYTPGTSFNYTSKVTICGPGFDPVPVEDCNCTEKGCE